MRDVFSTLPGALAGLGADDAAREAIVAAAWRRAVGSGLTEQTAPRQLNGKVLTVAVSSETWRKNIADLAGPILFKLNGALGSPMVSYLEFVVDADYVQAQTKRQGRGKSEGEWRALVANELSPQLLGAADVIEDEALRKQFLRASANSLARQKLDNENTE